MSTIDFTQSFEKSGRPLVTSANLAPKIEGLLILLAEDSQINRFIAVHLLESHGHSVVVAANGREAVEAVEHRQFDVVLMDVQMPELDGFDATALIREKERATGAHIPIIAITAQAMKGDRERCLSAGMDGYVSKPIRPGELVRAINEAVLCSAASAKIPREEPAIAQESAGPSDIDLAALLDSVNGNSVLLSKLVALFLDHYPRMLAELREAIDQGDGKRLARAAHTLRGGSGGFLTASARTALTSLEAFGNAGTANEGEAELAGLETEMGHIEKMLGEFVL